MSKPRITLSPAARRLCRRIARNLTRPRPAPSTPTLRLGRIAFDLTVTASRIAKLPDHAELVEDVRVLASLPPQQRRIVRAVLAQYGVEAGTERAPGLWWADADGQARPVTGGRNRRAATVRANRRAA